MNLDDEDTVDELPARPHKTIPAADRELLELAARALGAVRVEDVEGENWLNLHFEDGSTWYGWNPLLFYGDTFELAVKLKLGPVADEVWAITGSSISEYERDPVAATARAVVRAAAEIGQQKSS
jgi:hypothetical protein